MGGPDQAEESRKMEELYAQMSVDELLGLAEKVDDLTDLAQQTLKAELARRGPKMVVTTVPGRMLPDL